jgi:hypothetical protein
MSSPALHRHPATHALLARAGIGAYLDAVDQAANSNTFLLDGEEALRSLTPESLFAYLRSDAFAAAMFQCDAQREWFHLFDVKDPIPEFDSAARIPLADLYEPREGSFLKADTPEALRLTAADRKGLREHLLWLLTGIYSPYNTHLPATEAEPLVDAFLRAIESEAPILEATFCAPDFLHSVEYGTAEDDFEPHPLAYFDGLAESDRAVFFRTGRRGFLLLNNGSP